MKKISIIVLSYQHEKYISQNLESIFMQKINFPVELIICDDASKDGTDAIIKKCILKAPEGFTIKYTRHKSNKGATPNFYYALQQVTGDFLSLCEGDDYWTDQYKLETQYNFLISHPEYAMCFHQTINISSIPELNGSLFSIVEDRDYSAFEIYKHWQVHTTGVMMKTEVLKGKVLNEMLKHQDLLYFDTILYMSASNYGKIKGIPQLMSAYRRHDIGISHGINYKRDLKHNELDEIIGELFDIDIKHLSDWLIFSRSRIAFFKLLKLRNFSLAFNHLKWMIKKKRNLKIYLKSQL
ncbi:glycosyltransferase [Empedobacter brevis]|uniref:glycosyltransferase n=1 Tax=Empedobacter brevis TaxID=247 RepID=UPI0039AFCA7E